ncbi:MFS transporter [Blastococcus sp. Marseille-P5729]|uniref:MFS transporter n=1 Tax=Blastococcus sp. Marseille-P5729 TaxID=2086582 RepID=UPI000D0E8EF3|nr:MFS transporter [Blastococcus sp. Marseille-P5729]
MSDDQIAPGLRRGYSMGALATGAFGTVPGLLLLPYLTDTLGVSALLAGLIVFLPKAWDVVLSPMVGRWSDHAAVRTGSRRPYLLWGGVALAVSFALLFAGVFTDATGGAWWTAIMYSLCATAVAFFGVPYMAMPAEMTDSYHERTRIQTLRVAFLAVAILISGAGAPAIRNAVGGADGYRVMGFFVATVMLIGVLGAYFGTRNARRATVLFNEGTLWTQLRSVMKVRDFTLLAFSFAIQYVSIGMMLAGVDYIANYYLNSDAGASIIFVLFVGPALITMPLWNRLGQRFGKKTGFMFSTSLMLLGVALNSVVLLGFSPATGKYFAYALVMVVGVGYAGAQVFPVAMLHDTAAVDARRTGVNRIGLFTGVWGAIDTVTMAAGTGMFAVMLAIGNYAPAIGLTPDGPRNPAMTEMILAFTLVPAVFFIISLILLRGYRLTGQDVEIRLSDDDIPAGAGDSSEAVDPVDAGALAPGHYSPHPVVDIDNPR